MIKVCILSIFQLNLACSAAVVSAASANSPLDVRPSRLEVTTSRIGGLEANVSLTCVASTKPVLCLWKTPYGHVYTLSEGVSAESGRLRHASSSSGATPNSCGLQIVGVQDRDAGEWECEVGAVVGEDFQTKTARINLAIQSKTHTKYFLLPFTYIAFEKFAP